MEDITSENYILYCLTSEYSHEIQDNNQTIEDIVDEHSEEELSEALNHSLQAEIDIFGGKF